MLRKSKGFTLIELLIVVAIIGILAALLIPNAIMAIQKSKQKGTMKDLNTLSTAMIDYSNDHGTTPTCAGAMTATQRDILSPFYIQICPITDQWNNTINMFGNVASGSALNRGINSLGRDDGSVESFGRNGLTDSWSFAVANPEAGLYQVGAIADFNLDLVMFNGTFIRGPRTRQ